MASFIFFFTQLLFAIVIVYLHCVPRYAILHLKRFALAGSYIIFIVLVICGYIAFQQTSYFASPTNLLPAWLSEYTLLDVSYIITLDALAFIFIALTAFLLPLIMASSWNNVKYQLREFLITLLIIEWLLINLFLVMDLLLFYIFFEAILIPMFFLIGVWGSRQRKTYAAFMFFFYTFVGSLFMLLALILLYNQCGTLQIYNLVDMQYTRLGGLIIWPLFMFAFAVKVPMFPTHIWLPEAHVEAPTVGSVLLAGILLKLGIFAIFRFLIPMLPVETQYYSTLVYVFALLGILYVSLTTIRQTDLKKIIAYASVAHMNYVVLGTLGTNIFSVSGAIFLMVGHGIVSAGLFFLIGFLYDRYKTRNVRYYRGLVTFMPVFTISFFILSLANMSFPGTCNFIAEALILFGMVQNNIFPAALATVGIIWCAIYTIWLYNRISFGPITPSVLNFSDLSYKESAVVLPLIILTVYFGLYPNTLLSLIDLHSSILLESYIG